MNKSTQSVWQLITLVLLFGVVLSGAQLIAQQSAPQPNQQSPTAQQPQQPAQQAPAQPEQQAPSSQAQSQQMDTQVFTGTIVKSGDKYVLQDPSGKTYDIDHQDLVKKHEGKQVRVNGTLDPDGKTIHVK